MVNENQNNQILFKGDNRALRKYERTSHKENSKWRSPETRPRCIAMFLSFVWPLLSVLFTYQVVGTGGGWYDYVSWYMCICFPFEIFFAAFAINFYKNDKRGCCSACAFMRNTSIVFENDRLVIRYVVENAQNYISLVGFAITQDVNLSRRVKITKIITEYDVPYDGIESIKLDECHPRDLVLKARCVRYVRVNRPDAPATRTPLGCFENHGKGPTTIQFPLIFEGGKPEAEKMMNLLREKTNL